MAARVTFRESRERWNAEAVPATMAAIVQLDHVEHADWTRLRADSRRALDQTIELITRWRAAHSDLPADLLNHNALITGEGLRRLALQDPSLGRIYSADRYDDLLDQLGVIQTGTKGMPITAGYIRAHARTFHHAHPRLAARIAFIESWPSTRGTRRATPTYANKRLGESRENRPDSLVIQQAAEKLMSTPRHLAVGRFALRLICGRWTEAQALDLTLDYALDKGYSRSEARKRAREGLYGAMRYAGLTPSRDRHIEKVAKLPAEVRM